MLHEFFPCRAYAQHLERLELFDAKERNDQALGARGMSDTESDCQKERRNRLGNVI
jgi:hypothetical protein